MIKLSDFYIPFHDENYKNVLHIEIYKLEPKNRRVRYHVVYENNGKKALLEIGGFIAGIIKDPKTIFRRDIKT